MGGTVCWQFAHMKGLRSVHACPCGLDRNLGNKLSGRDCKYVTDLGHLYDIVRVCIMLLSSAATICHLEWLAHTIHTAL